MVGIRTGSDKLDAHNLNQNGNKFSVLSVLPKMIVLNTGTLIKEHYLTLGLVIGSGLFNPKVMGPTREHILYRVVKEKKLKMTSIIYILGNLQMLPD